VARHARGTARQSSVIWPMVAKGALSPPFGPPQGGMRLLSAKRLSPPGDVFAVNANQRLG